MERQRRFRRHVTAVVIAGLTLAACTSDEDDGFTLARDACRLAYMDAGQLSGSAAREHAREKTIPRLEKSADKAAQAALRDGNWQSLATAMSDAAEHFSVGVELGELRATGMSGGYSISEYTDRDADLQARFDELSGRNPAAIIAAECRKTKG
ncbi:hypothetical protein ACFWNG_03910 [Streptomyces sp. NPDC058391]|uniref:hypothetical protein n=1 Tax=Streptomyces sp. NPDC058391 TaxID=3346476 RepID=UPI003652B5F4